MKCEVCKRDVEFPFRWDLSTKGLKNLNVCAECDLSLSEQIFIIMEELKIQEPYIVRMQIIMPISFLGRGRKINKGQSTTTCGGFNEK